MQNKLGSFVVKFSSVILFLAVCYVALFYAYGYQYDVKKKDVVKTSIIDLIGNIKEARVALDGKLKANFLPYQIKNLDPGYYRLSVNKKGFLPWERSLKVEEDIVTIVNDILLVPENLDVFTRLVKDFTELGTINFGTDLVFSYQPGNQVVHLLDMSYDGTYREEELELSIPGIKAVESLENDRFLVESADDKLNFFDFRNRRFLAFNKPDDSYGFKLDAAGSGIFFMIGRTLYFAGLDDLTGDDVIDLEKTRRADDVTAVAFGFPGEIYYISGGVIYKADHSLAKIGPLALSLDRYKNLSFSRGRDFAAMVLRSEQDVRSLYVVDKKGRFKKMSDNVEGKVFLNGYDQMLFTEAEVGGNLTVYYYDANLAEKVTVFKSDKPVELLGWFSDEGHFIYRRVGAVWLGDVFNANTYKLLDDRNLQKVFVFSKNLFYLVEDKLYSLNWRNLL